MTLNVHEDNVVLCEQGDGLSDSGLSMCHPLS